MKNNFLKIYSICHLILVYTDKNIEEVKDYLEKTKELIYKIEEPHPRNYLEHLHEKAELNLDIWSTTINKKVSVSDIGNKNGKTAFCEAINDIIRFIGNAPI